VRSSIVKNKAFTTQRSSNKHDCFMALMEYNGSGRGVFSLSLKVELVRFEIFCLRTLQDISSFPILFWQRA